MFSNNGKISNHQAVRLLILDIFTGGCLFLPMALPRISGSGGWVALLLGLILTWANGQWCFWCLKHVPAFQKLCLKGVRWFAGLRCFFVYVFLMGMFGSVLEDTFLHRMPKGVILAGMTAVVIYGASKGMEVRARLSEIFIYIVLIPMVVLGLFSLPEAQWGQLMVTSEVTALGILKGALVTWVLMTPLEWLFYMEAAEAAACETSRRQSLSVFRRAVFIGGGLCVVMYLLCVIVLGTEGMAGERWPTAILMQIVRIPGGFMSRQDSVMLSFWIFAMFIGLSGGISHMSRLWSAKKHKAFNGGLCVYAIAGSILAYFTGMNQQFVTVYFYGMLISGAVFLWLLPLLVRLRYPGRRIQKMSGFLAVVLLLSGLLTGCEGYEALENRQFVMAMGIDVGVKEGYIVSYAFPDFGEVTGQDSQTKKIPVVVEAEGLLAAEQIFNQRSDKTLDYGQVKVLVLGKRLCEDTQALTQILDEIKHQTEIARTILVCQSVTGAQSIIEADAQMEGSVGLYVSGLLQNNACEVILNDYLQRPMAIALPKVKVLEDDAVFLLK